MSSTKALRAELRAMDERIDALVAERKAWMDAHMADFAKWPIGTELFDLDSGRSVGVIAEFYRYPDDSMSVEYRFTNGDNTSRYGRYTPGAFGSKADLRAQLERSAT